MVTHYRGTAKIHLPSRVIDKQHLNFLLMMPEDVLDREAKGSILIEALRRLITIQHFLIGKAAHPKHLSKEVKKAVGRETYGWLIDNEPIDTVHVKPAMKERIKSIRSKRRIEKKQGSRHTHNPPSEGATP